MENFTTDFVLTWRKFCHKIVSKGGNSMEENNYANGSVPVQVVARICQKDACWVRAGIISGYLPIGTATRKGKLITSVDEMDSRLGRINYYISPKKLYEETGYIWRGEKK